MPADAAQPQIAEVEVATAQSLVVVRCHEGVVHPGTRFRRIRDVAEPIDLMFTELWRYANRQVEALDPPPATRVILTGTGGELVRPGHLIQEINQAKL